MSGLSVSSSYHHPLVTQPPLVETKKYFCPFLERGYCREASRCNFSHDNRGSTKIPTDYCHFFLANQCLYGQDCKFRHTEPLVSARIAPQIIDPSSTATTAQSNSSPSPHSSPVRQFEENPNQNNNHHHHFQITPAAITSSSTLTRRQLSTASSSLLSLPISSSSSRAILTSSSGSSVGSITNTSINASSAAVLGSSSGGSCSTSCNNNNNGKPQMIATYSSHFTKELSSNPKKQEYPPLCPYSSTTGECPFPEGKCSYLHGQDCDLCGHPCLHPYDLNQQREHRDDCLREHEREMELSFAVQRSKDKVCGICMDTVVEKKPITSSRFGILEKCNHIFCLDCIRKWRGTKQFETRTIRACPECRVSSDFVVPSKYWIEDQEDKDKLIHDYKAALRSKPCKYFDEGKGECPFAGSCFYKHAYPDGRIAKLETPKPRRRVYGARGATSTVANYILWNILASTDDDDWSIEEHESLYVDPPDFGSSEEEDLDEDEFADLRDHFLLQR